MGDYPRLVEKNIKYILDNQLYQIKLDSEKRKMLILNIGILLLLLFIIFITLYFKYNGKQDVEKKKDRERKKKEYILNRLRKYQNMIEQPLTNIPFI